MKTAWLGSLLMAAAAYSFPPAFLVRIDASMAECRIFFLQGKPPTWIVLSDCSLLVVSVLHGQGNKRECYLAQRQHCHRLQEKRTTGVRPVGRMQGVA